MAVISVISKLQEAAELCLEVNKGDIQNFGVSLIPVA